MSIVETLQTADVHGSADIYRRAANGCPREIEAKARLELDGTMPYAANLPRQRDLAIQNAAHALLRNSSYSPVRGVSCEVRQCVLTLSGRVPSYYMKQMAQTIVRHLLEGRMVIDNQLQVD